MTAKKKPINYRKKEVPAAPFPKNQGTKPSAAPGGAPDKGKSKGK